MTGLIEDLRYGLRGLARNRGFAAIAILSLALGTGAVTTIFTFVNAVFLRPLPVADPATLAAVFTVDPRIPGNLGCSYPNYKDYRDRNQSFSSLLAYYALVGSLTGGGTPRRVNYHIVSGNYFQTLGVEPVIGRAFLPEEDRSAGASPVAVISDALWKREFGGDPHVSGRTVELNGRSLRIVGVAPAGFQGPNLLGPADIWVPMAMFDEMSGETGWLTERRGLFFSVVGRLKPGVSLERAQTEMVSLSQDLEHEYPQVNEGRRIKLLPVAEGAINSRTRPVMAESGRVLMIVAGLVLLIACANVAHLLLARATGRSKEFAVRLALGASRWRLVRQLLTESIVLALAGGAAGLALAAWGRQLLWSVRPPLLAYAAFPIEVDGRVLSFALAVSLLTGLLFGLAPALRAARPDLATDLKERAGQPMKGMGGRGVRSALVVGEIGLCVVALVGAGLFIRSLQNAEEVDTGFQADRLAMVTFNLSDLRYNTSQTRQFQRRVLERAAAVPGIVSAALTRDSIFRVSLARTVVVEDNPQAGRGLVTLWSSVSPGYLSTTGITLVRGREFSDRDTQDAPRVAIVNEAAAARYWPNQDPVGRRLRFFGQDAPMEVVGLARNANYMAVGEAPQALIYTPFDQDLSAEATLVVRTTGSPEGAAAEVRRAVQTMEPHLRMESRTVRSAIANTLWLQQLSAALLGGFAGLGLLLAGMGIYGVISYSVARRVREIGVRMALGATPGNVQRLIVLELLRVVAAGVIGGLLIALGASQGIRSLLFLGSKNTFDPLTFLLVPVPLVLVALAACWLPVVRATRIDPAKALREE